MIDLICSLPAILQSLGADEAAVEQMVFVAWRRCVDGALAENVVPVKLEGHRLIAAVPTETWRRQVSDLGPPLATKLNKMLGSELVKFVEFRVDPQGVASARDSRQSQEVKSIAEPPAELAAAAEAIADASLRQVFLRAASSSLARTDGAGK